MKVINHTKRTILGSNIRVADNFFTRLVGLLATAVLPPGAGLIIKPCSSIHTFGMRYPIDVIFVDGNHTVIKVVANLGRGKLAAAPGSKYVIELPAGTAATTGTQSGDKLALAN